MIRLSVLGSLLLASLVASCAIFTKSEIPDFEEPYLGREPPGLTSKPFAPER